MTTEEKDELWKLGGKISRQWLEEWMTGDTDFKTFIRFKRLLLKAIKECPTDSFITITKVEIQHGKD